MQKSFFLFIIMVSLVSYSSDKYALRDENSLLYDLNSAPVAIRQNTMISCNDTCREAINTWPITSHSENWFDLTNKNSIENGITYVKPGLGCIINAQEDEKKYYILKDPYVSCYYRNFMDGPNNEFEVFCVNYKESLTHKIKIYLREQKKTNMYTFNIITDQTKEAICACAIALSPKNRIAVSARNINPAHTPFTIFSITSDNKKPRLSRVSFTNDPSGLHFTKLTFLSENELIGLQNTGKLYVITNDSNQTIAFKKIRHQKFLWPHRLKDFAYNTSTHELMCLDYNNTIHFSTVQNESVSTFQTIDLNTFKQLVSLEHHIITINLIKSHQEFCCIFFTIDQQMNNPHYVTFKTNFLKEHTKTATDTN